MAPRFILLVICSAAFVIAIIPLTSSSIGRGQHQNMQVLKPNLSDSGVGLSASSRYEGSSSFVHVRYHMGPVLSSPIVLYLIWYGKWNPKHQSTIRSFLLSISDESSHSPSVYSWWATTVALYTDQTNSNVTTSITIGREVSDAECSVSKSLTRLSMQQVIANSISFKHLPVNNRNGVYLILTAPDITVQDFCRAVCGFHFFTFPSIVGNTLPYAWVGNSGKQCPETCAYPFAVPAYMTGATKEMEPPNGDAGVDGMISVIGHELAELASNPLMNAWYAGDDPTAPTEIGDLCEGVYGTGGGGGYTGQVSSDEEGRRYNLIGKNGKKFLVQWIWSPVLKACSGPNATDRDN
ncbi:Phosphate-responsive 1 family protein [Zostera marina]|uniref:Phosphate-responsive 1 family protein n=1 Tax=Zostera marina TaxID=29655 RepID=A0A0K9PFT2_ZOSMR|nr:Phosphate-responsive 1 family protein [Zostera marina]